MRKIYIILLVLLSGLCFACQLDLAKVRVERALTASWQSYCRHFITSDGQVVIPEEGGGTISEGQAYALLRAVWANDATVFNRVYAFTYEKLSRVRTHGDSLLAWRWGRLPGGAWGVLDANSATDGDLDYALALVLAHRRGWRAPPNLPDYREEARRVQADILAKEVVVLPGGDVLLTPGNWHELKPPYLVNPSYFSPAAYRLFASPPGATDSQGGAGPVGAVREPPLQVEVQATTDHARWSRLHQSTYKLLQQLAQGLEGQTGVGLFPDWCRVDAAGRAAPAPGKDTRFGWEAVRLPYRLALDGLWFKEPRAAQLLAGKFLPFFKSQWQAHGRLLAVYNFDGSPAVDYESPVLYAGVLAGALAAGDREFAHQMALKILSFYHEDGDRAYFEAPDHYYANNWAWLGLALYAGWVK
ncbi:MAG: glycosyl hydrolase family 8 [Deltaproteobacteria bacterium]|nr:glycosyl hydrolase family 8 [Deltaproteobacteria bacterium]